jgi:hypothetical protein
MAYNVSGVNEPARADRLGGEAGSRPFPSYTFHGLPGQRAKRASVNPACYPRVTAATAALQKPELGGPEPVRLAVERIPRANRHPPQAGSCTKPTQSTRVSLLVPVPIHTNATSVAVLTPQYRALPCFRRDSHRLEGRRAFSTGRYRMKDRSRLELRLPEPTARRPRPERPKSSSRRIPADRSAP